MLNVFPAWELFHRLTREEAIEYLDKRASQGFNAVLAVFLPELECVIPISGCSSWAHYSVPNHWQMRPPAPTSVLQELPRAVQMWTVQAQPCSTRIVTVRSR